MAKALTEEERNWALTLAAALLFLPLRLFIVTFIGRIHISTERVPAQPPPPLPKNRDHHLNRTHTHTHTHSHWLHCLFSLSAIVCPTTSLCRQLLLHISFTAISLSLYSSSIRGHIFRPAHTERQSLHFTHRLLYHRSSSSSAQYFVSNHNSIKSHQFFASLFFLLFLYALSFKSGASVFFFFFFFLLFRQCLYYCVIVYCVPHSLVSDGLPSRPKHQLATATAALSIATELSGRAFNVLV